MTIKQGYFNGGPLDGQVSEGLAMRSLRFMVGGEVHLYEPKSFGRLKDDGTSEVVDCFVYAGIEEIKP